jgi:hypothetical protein
MKGNEVGGACSTHGSDVNIQHFNCSISSEANHFRNLSDGGRELLREILKKYCVNWIQIRQNGVQLRGVVYTIMNLQIPCPMRNSLTCWLRIIF